MVRRGPAEGTRSRTSTSGTPGRRTATTRNPDGSTRSAAVGCFTFGTGPSGGTIFGLATASARGAATAASSSWITGALT